MGNDLKTKVKHTKPLPAVGFLRSILIYCAESGDLIWLPRIDKVGRPNTKYAGKVAGNIGSDGYRYVMIDGENFMAHRIAWKIETGLDPIDEIDHEDLCRSNNRWINLREATHGENNHNVRVKAHSVSGIKGVRYLPKSNKWTAAIRKDGCQYYLGSFETVEGAMRSYANAVTRLYGDMARVF